MDAKKLDSQNEENLKRSVLEQLDALDAEDKLRMLDFSRELARRERAREQGGALLAFAGTISRDDLAQMGQTIEEECERVDEDEW